MYCLINKGIYNSLEDTPLFAHLGAAGHAAQFSVGGGSGGSQSKSVKFSNAELQRIRSSCSSGFHLAANILCMVETKSIWMGICGIVAPI